MTGEPAIRDIALALIVDGLLVQLPSEVKSRPYMVKIYRAVKKKNQEMLTRRPQDFSVAFQLATDTGIAVEKTGNNFSSISKAIELILKRNPVVIDIYKLNPKHLQKMYDVFSTETINFRSSRFASAVIECLDIEASQMHYRRDRDDTIY